MDAIQPVLAFHLVNPQDGGVFHRPPPLQSTEFTITADALLLALLKLRRLYFALNYTPYGAQRMVVTRRISRGLPRILQDAYRR